MGILGGGSTTTNSSGGILGRKEREGQAIRSALPEVFNPSNQLGAISERLTPVVEQKTSLPSTADLVKSDFERFKPKHKQTPKEWIEGEKQKRASMSTPGWDRFRKALEPLNVAADYVMAYTPGLSDFQRGAGNAIGVEAHTAPGSDNPFIRNTAAIAGTVAGTVTNPSNIGQGLVTVPYKMGQGAAQAAANKAPVLGNKFAQRGIEGAVAGGIQGGVISGVRGETELDELATNIALGAGLGAGGDIALAGIGSAAKALINKYRPAAPAPSPILGLPAPKQRGNANTAAADDVITPEYQFKLDAPSERTLNQQANVKQARDDLKIIDDEIRQLEASYERAVIEEYDYLQQSLKERGGVQQGLLQQTVDGEVVGRTGRISNNPLWYQEWYAANGKVPSKKELYTLAKQRVDEGFKAEEGTVPSWKARNGYDESMEALQSVRSTINKSIDQALGISKIEPVDINELVRSYGYTAKTPENIGKVYTNKTWYHGTGTDSLSADTLDPFVGSHESLFGQGVYLTDNLKIADGYAKNRGGRKGKKPTIYEANVKVDRVLDLEDQPTQDVAEALYKSMKGLDYSYNYHFEEPGHFSGIVESEIENGATVEQIIQKVRKEIESFSYEAEISTNEFVEDMQNLAINLKQAGYDGLTHTGGHRTGNNPHRVLILLDPQNHYGGREGISQVTSFGKHVPEPEAPYRTIAEGVSVVDAPLTKTKLSFTPKERKPILVRAEEPSVQPMPLKEDVILPRTQIAAADESLGINPFGSKGRKYTNPDDTRTYIATKTDREPINIAKMADDFYMKNVDNMQRVNQFDKYVEAQTGKKLNADERAYYSALNSRGSDVTAKHILTERLVDSQGTVVGHSLKDITSQIPASAYDNFLDYLIAKHAPTRMARGERVYREDLDMTIPDVEAKVADYERSYPQFKEIAEQLYDWDTQLAESWLVDTGIIPEEMLIAWKEANPYWSPNQRKFTELEKRNRGSGAKRGFSNQNNPVREYSKTGSSRDIVDPIESRIEYVDRYVKTANRNRVMQVVYKQLQRHPEELEGFATILRKENIDGETMNGDGLDALITSLDDEFNKTLHASDHTKDNVISALVNGERVYMRVDDPDFLDALSNLTPQATNAIVEGARKITSTMKTLTTGINPIFGLTRNIFRDIPEAYIFSKTTDNPFRYAWDVLDGFVSVFADGGVSAISNSRTLQKLTPERFKDFLDDRARLYKDYKALGGGHSSPVSADRNLLAQSKRDILPQQRKGPQLGARAWTALENLNNALESAPRLGEFKRSRKADPTYAGRVKGIFEAQDVTTNFKRHGQVVKDADAFIPYLNAAVQGLDKFARAFKDRPAAVTAKALAMISAPTIALYALNYNNPNYQKLNNYTKDNFYLIPTTDGTFVKIPKPRELGVPFGGLLERTMRAWNEEDPEAFKDFANTAQTMFTPPGLPLDELMKGDLVGAAIAPLRDTVAGPLVDVAMNENFIGAPIVPKYLEDVSPRYQYDANTSEVSKKLGDVLNASPKQIDHLIRSYTGMIGQIGLPATTEGATVGETLKKQVTADPVFSTDASGNFYDLKEKLGRQYADAKHTGVAPEGYDDDARKYMNRVASQMSEYTKALKELDTAEGLSKQEKKDYKRQLTDERNELARQAYIAVRDALKASSK